MKKNRPQMINSNYVQTSFYVLLFIWVTIISASLIWNYIDCRQRYNQIASLMADIHFDKEKALRLWVASRGGVYVPSDEKNPPNPLLWDVPGRDIISSEKSVTLVPGFHLVRQLREEFPDLYKVGGNTVSLKPLRKENSPDEWQKRALESFEAGSIEAREFTQISGEPYLRLMRPHYAQAECLKCHGKEGYVEGDILGGVEVSLPIRGFLERQEQRTEAMVASHGAIFAVGFIGMVIGIRSINRRETARNEIQKALLSSEEKYRHLVEEATDIIYQIDRHGSFTFSNSGALKVFGYSEAELAGRNYLEFVEPSHRDVAERFWKQALEKNCSSSYFECPFLSKDGTVVWLGQNVQLIKSGDDVTGFQAIARDMTERREMEESLKQSEGRYKSLYSMIRLMCDNVPDLIWAKDLEKKFLFVNRATCEKLLMANDIDEPIGKTDMYFVDRERNAHPDDPDWHTFGEICVNSDEVVLVTRNNGRFNEFGNVRGKFLYLDVYKTPLWNEQGEMVGVVGSGRDVTEERMIKDSLQESEARYRELFEYASDMIYTHDLDGNYTSVNQVVKTLLGFTEDEFLKLNFRDIADPGYLPIIEENFLKDVRDGVEFTGPYEVLVRGKEGALIWFEIKSRLITRGQIPVGVHGIARNITDRKILEKALYQVQATYRSVVDAFDGIIHVSSPDHVIEFANQRLIDRTGYDPIGKKCFKVLHGLEDVCPWCKFGKENVEATFKRERLSPKDNRWYYVVSSPFYHEDGRLSRIFLMHDLDMQKKAEAERENLKEQLVHAQKMESIGTLAGGIAHDFNNLLQVIQGFSQMLLMKKNEQDRDYAYLQRVVQAARSGADLVQRILAFSRKARINPQPLDLNHHAQQAKTLLNRIIPKMIAIELILEDELATVNADPIQLEQIFINLALNAKDAMPDGGKMTIRTRNVTLSGEDRDEIIGLKPGDYALLTVSDTGLGMDEHTINHIFEPFFTTKEVGHGSGLGLSMVYGIVKQHEGHITCHSKPGLGTAFNIYFPVTKYEIESDLAFDNLALLGGSETILVVDDEEDLRELGQSILEMSGYTVLTAINGEEALNVYQKEMNRVSLVILDMIMPIMGGRQCIEELIKVNPKIKVLLSSGIGLEDADNQGFELGACGLVKKPFDVRQFLEAVRSALDNKMVPH